MHIRRAAESDKEELFPLVLQSQLFQKQEVEKETIQKIDQFKENTRENFEKWFGEEDKEYFVAEENGKIIGFILLMTDDVVSNTVSLSDVFVKEECRKQGFATELVNHAIDWSKESGAKEIVLAVGKNNTQAIELYRKAGFTEKEDDYIYLSKNF
jgi:ribosomal protein S18 acetylase RimI-like enzyme